MRGGFFIPIKSIGLAYGGLVEALNAIGIKNLNELLELLCTSILRKNNETLQI